MSPLVPRKKDKFTIPTKYYLLIFVVICAILLVVTFLVDIPERPANVVLGYTVVPLQKGISAVGTFFVDRKEMMKNLAELQKENEELKVQIDDLTNENIQLKQEKFELVSLREMFDLDAQYSEYDKTGARVIAGGTTNWFDSFSIDKGTNEGLELDMNVLSGSGLCGRIVDVGPNWARVLSIIDDTSHISAEVLSTSDRLIVSGDLEAMKENHIRFTDLLDEDNRVAVGDKIVTSGISDKYLPGILIGYISSIESDPNNLTKSGLITPAVDFKHVNDVLVIKKTKQETGEE